MGLDGLLCFGPWRGYTISTFVGTILILGRSTDDTVYSTMGVLEPWTSTLDNFNLGEVP